MTMSCSRYRNLVMLKTPINNAGENWLEIKTVPACRRFDDDRRMIVTQERFTYRRTIPTHHSMCINRRVPILWTAR